jgi:sRNA-binding regulator protein Hfq
MKNGIFFLFFSFIFCTALVAQQSDTVPGQQIIFLDNGTILTGVLEEVDRKIVRILNNDASLTIKKKKIKQLVPIDIYSDALTQNSESLIILKNKDWLKAEVQEVSQESVLLKSDTLLSRIPRSKIFKIYPPGQTSRRSEEFLQNTKEYNNLDVASFDKEDQMQTKGSIYNISSILVMPRLVLSRDGFGIQHTTGYTFNPYFGLGVNLGITKYSNDFISIFEDDRGFCIDFCSFVQNVTAVSSGLSVRGEFNQRKIRPFYNIDFGFTRTIRGEETNRFILQIEGNDINNFDRKDSRPNLGYIFQPTIGMQINAKSLTLLFDIGFQFADVNYEPNGLVFKDDETFIFTSRNEEIRGFIFKVGIML